MEPEVQNLYNVRQLLNMLGGNPQACLLYTSDAADERSSVDLGGRRIIKKKNSKNKTRQQRVYQQS